MHASVMLKNTSVYLWFSNCLNLVIVWKWGVVYSVVMKANVHKISESIAIW